MPQLFVGTGAAIIGRQHAKFPWTIGLLPSNEGEGAIYGRLIAKEHPKAKIGVLYENDEYGQELLAGLKRGLGAKARQIVGTRSRTPYRRIGDTQVRRSRHRAPTRS